MIHLLTAGPGSGKSLYSTELLLKLSRENIKNLRHNYFYAKAFFEKIVELKLEDELLSVLLEKGQGLEKEYELVFLEKGHFDFLTTEYQINVVMDPETDDLQRNFPDYYFERASVLNEIIKKINADHKTSFAFFKPVRTIYTNLDNLKLTQCRPLPPNCDWRATPQGSYYVIDEAQLIPIFSEEARGIDPIVKDLTIHRKLGYDFLFITQDPTFIHKYIRKLATLHIHLINIFGWEQSMMMQWTTAQDSPNAVKTIARAENITRWKFPKHIYGLYHSTTINTRKKRYPKKMLAFFALAGVFIFGAIGLFAFKDSSPLVNVATGNLDALTKPGQNNNEQPKTNTSTNTNTPGQTSSPGENNTQPVQGSNVLANGNNFPGSDPSQPSDLRPADPVYDPSKPFEYVPNSMPTVANHRVFSGCVTYQGKTFAVDQQGTRIDGFSAKDCRKILNNSYERPFDYFGNRQPPVQAMQQQKPESDTKPNLTERVSTSEPENQNPETSSS